jgi:hypothetical protein
MSGLINQSIPCVVVGKATGHEVHCPELSGAAVARLLYDRHSVSGRSLGRLETLAALNVHELDDLIVCPGRCGYQAGRDNNEEKREESAISHFEAALSSSGRTIASYCRAWFCLLHSRNLLFEFKNGTEHTPLLGQWCPPQPRGEQDH